MPSNMLFAGAHAPFWHNGDSITTRNYNIMLAALPAAVAGIFFYGIPALRVLALSVSSAMVWELAVTKLMKRAPSIGDGDAALIGLLLGMLLPATTPWYAVIAGTFVAIVVGKMIYGGLGCNPLNPVLVSFAILTLSWKTMIDFDTALVNYEVAFTPLYPLAALKHFGPVAISKYNLWDLFVGRQLGAVGATFGLGLVIGGIYLMARGIIRWEISISFLVGIAVTALIFNFANPAKYSGPLFHLLTGFTLIGAFFLATENSSSPTYFLPMVLYGLGAGAMTILIRNIGAFPEGVVFAILLMNVANPLLDKIRPRPLGRRV